MGGLNGDLPLSASTPMDNAGAEKVRVWEEVGFSRAILARELTLDQIASLQPGAKSLKTVLAAFQSAHGRAPKEVLWLIGPEGDFSAAEMSASKNFGFEPITLGPLVLRCETAAVYALSVLSSELQTGAPG